MINPNSLINAWLWSDLVTVFVQSYNWTSQHYQEPFTWVGFHALLLCGSPCLHLNRHFTHLARHLCFGGGSLRYRDAGLDCSYVMALNMEMIM